MNFSLKDYIEKNEAKIKKYSYIGIGVVLLIILYALFIGPYFKFKNNEKLFKEYVLDYCEQKTGCMPKEGNYKGFTLEKAYEDGIVKETLFVPNSDKMCDIENSWVRIFNEKGDYKTRVYLKCGMFSSLTDHTGPKITINGDAEVYAELGSEYTDLGVAKVKDNKDGDISVNEVKVNSMVNTEKAGDYTVTYTVYDSLKNKGSAERVVHVVSTLSEIVKRDTDDSNLYKGPSVDNFLSFSGMTWRIVGMNEDGSIKIVLHDGIAALTYGNYSYDESNVVKYLNTEFLNAIHDYKTYLKDDSKFCIDDVQDINNPTCNELSKSYYVGLLSIKDTETSITSQGSYLYDTVPTWLSNKIGDKPYSFKDGAYFDSYIDNIISVRPVVNLKNMDLYIESGNGSIQTPYKLHDYEYAKVGDSLNTRLVGEYVEYSGNKFVITGLDKDKNIILTSAGPFASAEGGVITMGYKDYDNSFKVLDNSVEGNLGYRLENELFLAIDSKYMVKGKWKLNEYNAKKYYSELASKDYEGYISIPNGEDLFSGNNGSKIYQSRPYPLANYLEGDGYADKIIVVNTLNGYGFKVDSEEYNGLGIRIKILLKNDVKISSGKGTFYNPYKLK